MRVFTMQKHEDLTCIRDLCIAFILINAIVCLIVTKRSHFEM
jgi:hypothetical protein